MVWRFTIDGNLARAVNLKLDRTHRRDDQGRHVRPKPGEDVLDNVLERALRQWVAEP